MFGWFRRDPRKKLEAQYARKLVQARDAQRNGNIQGYAALMAEAETILQELDAFSETVEESPGS
jgi:predicted metal-dependent hydrolase